MAKATKKGMPHGTVEIGEWGRDRWEKWRVSGISGT